MGRQAVAAVFAVLFLVSSTAFADSYDVSMSTLLGGDGDDEVVAAALQSDGTVVLAANFDGSTPGPAPSNVGDAGEGDSGYLIVLPPDAGEIRAVYRVGSSVHDLSVSDDDSVYVAAGDSGVVSLSSGFEHQWSAAPGHIHRLDWGAGRVVGLQPDNVSDADSTPGNGRVHVLSASDGSLETSFGGHRNTLDVCYSAQTETIVLVGWRQDRADGNPVQIAFLRGVGTSGATEWTAYDWSTENGADDFINRPENNMADTRGYRCSIGPQGDVYAAFETAGGNHIFRYDPFDISTTVDIVGGDKYHEFYNTRSEHKTFFARYDAATGDYRRGQQLTGRLSSNDAGNTVRVSRGAIEVDAAGRVYLVGSAAYGLPLTFTPEGTGEYTGGAYLLAMNAEFTERLYVTRMTPNGKGHALAVRDVAGETRLVYGGSKPLDKDEFYAVEPLQPDNGGGERDGFATLYGGEAGEPVDPGQQDVGTGTDAGGEDASASGSGRSSGGCGCSSTRRKPGGWLLVGFLLIGGALLRRMRKSGQSPT